MPRSVMLKKLNMNDSMKTYNPSRTNTHKRCPFYCRGLECKRSKIHFHHIIPGNTHSQQDTVGAVNHGQGVEPVFSAGRSLFLPSFTLHQQGVTETTLHSMEENQLHLLEGRMSVFIIWSSPSNKFSLFRPFPIHSFTNYDVSYRKIIQCCERDSRRD